MYKVKFLSDNKKEVFNPNEINYNRELLLIQKETNDLIIILDFKNKDCKLKLKKENLSTKIPVILMQHSLTPKKDIFIYILASEPDSKKVIIFTQK